MGAGTSSRRQGLGGNAGPKVCLACLSVISVLKELGIEGFRRNRTVCERLREVLAVGDGVVNGYQLVPTSVTYGIRHDREL